MAKKYVNPDVSPAIKVLLDAHAEKLIALKAEQKRIEAETKAAAELMTQTLLNQCLGCWEVEGRGKVSYRAEHDRPRLDGKAIEAAYMARGEAVPLALSPIPAGVIVRLAGEKDD